MENNLFEIEWVKKERASVVTFESNPINKNDKLRFTIHKKAELFDKKSPNYKDVTLFKGQAFGCQPLRTLNSEEIKFFLER